MLRLRQRGAADWPRVGMRVWLAAAFAAVGLTLAGYVYLSVVDSSQEVLEEHSGELAVGRTITLVDSLGDAERPEDVIIGSRAEGFWAWYFDAEGRLIAPKRGGPVLRSIEDRGTLVEEALTGRRAVEAFPGETTIVSVPVYGPAGVKGVVLSRFDAEESLSEPIDDIRNESLRALAIAVALAVLAGFLVATAIAHRVKSLARSANDIASGRLDVPLHVGGGDEIGDLSRALESMRSALSESFGVLTSDRDKLEAIFDGLTDAVMVVDHAGTVRFVNRVGAELARRGDTPPEPMEPHLKRAAVSGFAAHPALRIGDRAYAVQIRDLPAEDAVLVIARDRTDAMRKEWAERDFVSNAAHELRNPLAGISGAIEVLQSGAKDDPQARDHFLTRLSADSERMTRLIQALLALARADALGPSDVEIVDVNVAVQDVIAAVERPEGIELTVDIEENLAAQGDPTLLRQVLIGLLSNAYKNTPSPGSVTLRGRISGGDLLLEVQDTGVGIPAAEIERVFERFYRRTQSRSQTGFGLGLAIARRMVDVMGGTIGATSREGEGSTFWVRLPVAAPSPTPVA